MTRPGPPSTSTSPSASAGTTVPLLAALVCLLGFAATAVLGLAVPGAHERDAALLHGFMALGRTRLSEPLELVVHLGDVVPYAAAGLGLVAVALHQGRTWRAVAVATLLMATGVVTQVTKFLLATPRYDAWLELSDGQIGNAAFPSGHATAAMTLALCAVLVAPPAWRMLAAVAGWAFAAAMGYALLVLSWHYPSDVLGGYLMAGLWTYLALAALRVLEKRPGVGHAWRPDRRVMLGVAAGAALSAVTVLAAHGDAVTRYPSERPTLVIGALGIVALTGGLAAAFARAA